MYKEYVTKYKFILGEDIRKLPKISIYFTCVAIFDLIGIGLFPLLIKKTSEMYGAIPDSITRSGILSELFLLATLIMAIFILKSILAFYSNKKIIKFGLDHQTYIFKKIFKKYQNGDYLLLSKIPLSKTLNTIDNSIRIYIEQTLIASLKLFSELIILAMLIGYLLYQNFIFTIILFFIFITVLTCYDIGFKKNFLLASEMTQKSSTQIMKEVHLSIEGFKEIRIFGFEKIIFKKFSLSAEEYAKYGLIGQSARNLPRYLLECSLIAFSFVMTLYFVAIKTPISEIISLNVIYFLAGIKITPSLFQISNAISSMRFSTVHTNDIYNTINELTSKVEKQNFKFSKNFSNFHSLDINKISFKYDSKNIFREVSSKIVKGDCVHIRGESGSGKSTLIDVLVGLIIPTDGKILINSIELKDVLAEWQSKIAYLPQNVLIYESTLLDNITMEEDKEINYAKLIESCKKSQIYNLVSKSPDGFNTLVGPGGVLLSGGERKKLALARALYHEREIIILDELTAGIDSRSRDEIYGVLNAMSESITIIFSSHESDVKLRVNKYIDL